MPWHNAWTAKAGFWLKSHKFWTFLSLLHPLLSKSSVYRCPRHSPNKDGRNREKAIRQRWTLPLQTDFWNCSLGNFPLILASSTGRSWQNSIQSALHAYQQEVGKLWEGMELRVVAFTGAILLSIRTREDFKFNRDLARAVMQTGTFLLAQGIKQRGDAERILCEAIHDFSR